MSVLGVNRAMSAMITADSLAGMDACSIPQSDGAEVDGEVPESEPMQIGGCAPTLPTPDKANKKPRVRKTPSVRRRRPSPPQATGPGPVALMSP